MDSVSIHICNTSVDVDVARVGNINTQDSGKQSFALIVEKNNYKIKVLSK